MAKKKKTSEFAGAGCAIQAVGLVLLFMWPIGTLIGVVLFFVGSGMAIKIICSNCGNRVEKTSVLCPHCKEPFQ
jgi:uncharacterized membrane protein